MTFSARSRRWAAALLVTTLVGAVIATALVVRLRDLDAYGFGSDESVYAGQAQAIAGSSLWPAVRAHPPLLAMLLSVAPGSGAVDLDARRLTALIGVLGVGLAMVAGRLLVGWTQALLAGLFVALCPYHVDVSRQVLVDVPMATAFAAVVAALAGWVTHRRVWWLVVGALSAGLCLLSKETGLVALVGLAVGMVAHARVRVSVSQSIAVLVVVGAVASAYPLWLFLSASPGGGGLAWSYVVWQFDRTPNQEWFYHFSTTMPRMGPMLVFAVIGAGVGLRRREPMAVSLLSVVLVVLAFATCWPTKGYAHLLVTVVPLALLAGSGVVHAAGWLRDLPQGGWRRRASLAVALASTLTVTTTSAMAAPAEATTGVPAIREAARWLARAGPGCVVVGDVGVANIVRYYASTRPVALGLTDDLERRNPAYRTATDAGCVRYFVWDVWTELESPETAAQLVRSARQAHARVAHVETLPTPTGGLSPAVIVFEVPA